MGRSSVDFDFCVSMYCVNCVFLEGKKKQDHDHADHDHIHDVDGRSGFRSVTTLEMKGSHGRDKKTTNESELK